MATVQLQELVNGRVAAHNGVGVAPRWDKIAVFNTEVINSNLVALAQVLAPSLQLAACKPWLAQDTAAANNFVRSERVDFWYKGAAENTEIINANIIALGQALTPALQLTVLVGQIAKYADSLSQPGKLTWDGFTAENTEVINANLRAYALAQAAASAEHWLPSCNMTKGLRIKSAVENSEIVNANLIAFARALPHVVVQVVPPTPDQEQPACCLVM